MKFYDRKKEIETLGNLKGDFRVAVVGRRRIGKTRLVEDFYSKDRLTLFVSAEKSEKEIIKDWSEEYKEIPKVSSFKDLFEYLFTQKKDKLVFIDEMQNLLKVNKGFVFDLQRLIDKHKPRLVVSGSLLRMMKKMVENYKSPLFGRFDLILKLRELDFLTVAEICRDLKIGIEDSVKLYSVFGGVPKYYELIEKMKNFELESFVHEMFVRYPRPLYEEVKLMLKEEFGKEHRMFFSILSAISQGNTKLSEIANFVGTEQTKITKYLHLLQQDFEIIRRETPLVGGKRGVYRITSNLINFWFANIWKYQELVESEEEKLEDILKNSLNSWNGKIFESIAFELIKSASLELPVKFTRIGRQWGSVKNAEAGKNEYEIDIVCLDETRKGALFVECKWSDLKEKEAMKILEELKEKSRFVEWERHKEYFGLVGKKVLGKENLRKEGFFVWDLKDIENVAK